MHGLQKLIHVGFICPVLSLVLVERRIQRMQPGKSHHARGRGQINRYKASDLAGTTVFSGDVLL